MSIRSPLPRHRDEPSPPLPAFADDLLNTSLFFSLFMVVGMVCVWTRVGWNAAAATTLLWSLTCLASGAGVGFLFGIPKILQSDGAVASPAAPPAGADLPRSNLSAPPPPLPIPGSWPESSPAPAYRQRVNTNLEEISDWLTKIIVGLGLINFSKIPGKLTSLASLLASEMRPAGQMAFALSLLVYFLVIGFLYGYLFTRLFLQPAFARADVSAMTAGDALRGSIERATRRAFAANPEAGRTLTEDQVEAAEQVANSASGNDLSLVRQELALLSREYETIRACLPPGDSRTRQMEICVTKMRTLALVAAPLLPELTPSSSPGQRLAAIAILQVKPAPTYLSWLGQRLGAERAFMGYQAAVALLSAVRTLEPALYPQLTQVLTQAKAGVPQDTDRYRLLDLAAQELDQKVTSS